MQKFFIRSFAVIALALFGWAFSAWASGASFNNDPQDRATLRIVNYTDDPGCSSCWAGSASADPGDIVSLAIYYHNTSDETAKNVRVRLSPKTTGPGTSHAWNAFVTADNATQVSGSAALTISSSRSVSFRTGDVFWYPDQTTNHRNFPSGQSGEELFSSSGLLLGDIAPGWSTQGSVVARFAVSTSDGEPPATTNPPSVTTNAATNVGENTATLNCYVDPRGGGTTTRWFEWGSTPSLGNRTNTISHGSSAANVNETISGLSSNTVYYFRCAAQGATGGTVTGSTFSFTTTFTPSASQIPLVQTLNAEGVSQNFAVLKGHVDPRGNTNVTRWFEWGTASHALNNTTTKLGHGGNAGTFSDTVAGLPPATTYYFRAVAQSPAGTVYGSILSFSTSGTTANSAPFITTLNATNVGQNSATLSCYINPQGSFDTTRWFEWGSTPSLGNRTNTISHGSSAANVNETISGLSSNTTYYFRCVAQNAGGTTYGSTIPFTTGLGIAANPPVAITNGATNVDHDSARLNGVVQSTSGNANIGWFEWGVTPSLLGNVTSRENLGTGSSIPYRASLFGLSSNTVYYFRAVAENGNGISRGSTFSFRTNSQPVVVVPPTTPPSPSAPVRAVAITKTIENLDTPNGTGTSVTAKRGERVRFTIRVENRGNVTLTDLSIRDRIPLYAEFANAAENLAAGDPEREVVWFVGNLPAGESRTTTLDIVVTQDAPLGTLIENVARAENRFVSQTSNTASIRVADPNLRGEAAVAGFLPGGLFEWLLVILLILLILAVLRYLATPRNREL